LKTKLREGKSAGYLRNVKRKEKNTEKMEREVLSISERGMRAKKWKD
jgi:hypothetical protein